jgi:hypothetical protein
MRADPMPVTQRRRPAVRTGPLRCSVYLLRPAQLDTGTVFRSVVTQGAKVLRWQVLFGNCGGGARDPGSAVIRFRAPGVHRMIVPSGTADVVILK